MRGFRALICDSRLALAVDYAYFGAVIRRDPLVPPKKLAHKLPQRVVQSVLDTLSIEPGTPRIRKAAAAAASTVGAMCCIVAEAATNEPGRARTLALWRDGEFDEDLEYELHDTPCEAATKDDFCVYEYDVQKQFPDDIWLKDVRAQSYVGVRLAHADGSYLGHLAIIDSAPLDKSILELDAIQLLSALVRSELLTRHAQAQHLRVERRLAASARLESLGILAGGAAHDLNNVLVGILSHADFALRKLTGANLDADTTASRTIDTADSNEPVASHLRSVLSAAEHAGQLTRHMLALSGAQPPARIRLQASEVIRETISRIRVSLAAPVELLFEFDDEEPPVRADPTQLAQVVMNLVLNADQAMAAAGEAMAAAGEAMAAAGGAMASAGEAKAGAGGNSENQALQTRVRVDVVTNQASHLQSALVGGDVAAGDFLRIRVTDRGTGVPDSFHSEMFEPFVSARPDGSGLGLAAVRSIVEGHQGAIFLEPQDGPAPADPNRQGATFAIHLPVAPTQGLIDS